MRLEPIDQISAKDWNEAVAQYDTAMFYHDSAWLAFLQDTGPGELIRLKIMDHGKRIGYLAGVLLKKGPFRILGSPLSGTLTEYLGPIVEKGFDAGRFLSALDQFCRDLRIHHVELGSPILDSELMADHGFESSNWMTFRIPLSNDRNAMWSSLKSKCRNRIRKGIKNGLVVEEVADPEFVDRHYRHVAAVFARQNLNPPLTSDGFHSLFSRLKSRDLVFTLQVKHESSGEIVATGMFPHDHRRVYSVSTASGLNTRNLYPNELLYWTVMELAGQRGLEQFSVGDNYRTPSHGGRFKDKFNGNYERVSRHMKNYSGFAKYARQGYKLLTRVRSRFTNRHNL